MKNQLIVINSYFLRVKVFTENNEDEALWQITVTKATSDNKLLRPSPKLKNKLINKTKQVLY